MQAFIKNDKLIVNTMIQPNEKELLLEFISKAISNGVTPVELYNIEGNVSGIGFNINHIEEETTPEDDLEDEEEEVTD